MHRRIYAAVYSIVLLGQPPTVHSSRAYLDLRVVYQAAQGHVVVLGIANPTGRVVTFDVSALPWSSRYSMKLIAVPDVRAGRPLREALPVDDPSVGLVQIQPGGRREGSISLERRFPEFTEKLRRHDILLFWSYQAVPAGENEWKRLFGGSVIRRRP